MTKSLFKDLFREIWKSKNRFVSIMCIVAIGVAFFAGLKSAAPDMAYTIDNYFDEYNIWDLEIVSPLGLTVEDIEEIKKVDGVENVQAGFMTDAVTTIDESEVVFRLHSLPTGYVSDSNINNYINRIKLVEGRLPNKPNEIVVEKQDTMASDYDIKVGDVLKFSSGTSTSLTDGTMHYDEFTVVGLASTPLYLSYEMGTSQTISNKSINLFGYVPQEAFDYRNMYLENEDEDVYIEAIVTIKGAKELDCFDDKTYQELVDKVKSKIENVAVDRAMRRAEQLKSHAQKELDEAQKLYNKEKENYDNQISAAEKKLDDAKKQLIEGKAELESQKEIYKAKIKAAEDDIKDAEKTISQSEKAINEAEKVVNQAQKDYDDAVADNKDSLTQIKKLEEASKKLSQQSSSQRQEIINKINSNPDMTPEEYDSYVKLLAMYDSYDNLINDTDNVIGSLKSGVSAATQAYQTQLSNAKRVLNQAKSELASGKKQLANGKAELSRQKANAQNAFANGTAKLNAGQKQYDASKKEFEKQKKSGQSQLDEAELELASAQRKIDQITAASWYVFDRNYNYGYASYDNTVSSMSAMAQFLPVFFILVAILVCMTTMTRMIDEQRGIIGTYKALGYSNASISAKYVIYVLIASLFGAVVGAVIGIKLFPLAVYKAWSAMYSQPDNLMQTIHPDILISSFIISIAAMVLTAYFVCRSELNSVPSALMRPKAPKLGKMIFLERIPIFWNHLNFSQKVTVRNIFRYKKRLFMTIIGIMGCTALLLCGLGMNDTISSVVKHQYNEIFKFNISYSYTADSNNALSSIMDDSSESVDIEDQRLAIDNIVSSSDIVDSYTHIGSISVTAENKNNQSSSTEIVTLYVTEEPETLPNYIVLRNRVTGNPIEISDKGMVITEKLADRLGVSVGDSIDITSEQMTKKIEITGITENYISHYAYMTQEAYKEAFWYSVDQTSVLVNVKESATNEQYNELVDKISEAPGATSIMALNNVAESFNEQFTSLNQIVMIIILCAALLAFVVLYNLTNINISERLREIATIKVLGFKNKEVAIYVYSENLLLTIMGSILGLVGGVFLHRFVIKLIEQKDIMFGYIIDPLSYFNAIILTCVFSILVMIYMYRKLVNIPMVESLKSVE